jgi:antitoxin VapB
MSIAQRFMRGQVVGAPDAPSPGGRKVALAPAYNLLHRHDCRKLAPKKRHPQSDPLAIRLPKAFRVQASEVWISKDDISGVITLRPKDENERKKNLSELFRLIREQPFTEDFIPLPRHRNSPQPFCGLGASPRSGNDG